MKETAISQAVTMAAEGKPAFLTTVSSDGVPHVTTVGGLKILDPDHIRLMEWFCPRTVENTRENRQVSLVVWDQIANTGWQLTGKVEFIQDAAIMDGYNPEKPQEDMPQILAMLDLHVEKVMRFHHGPHSDKEE